MQGQQNPLVQQVNAKFNAVIRTLLYSVEYMNIVHDVSVLRHYYNSTITIVLLAKTTMIPQKSSAGSLDDVSVLGAEQQMALATLNDF